MEGTLSLNKPLIWKIVVGAFKMPWWLKVLVILVAVSWTVYTTETLRVVWDCAEGGATLNVVVFRISHNVSRPGPLTPEDCDLNGQMFTSMLAEALETIQGVGSEALVAIGKVIRWLLIITTVTGSG